MRGIVFDVPRKRRSLAVRTTTLLIRAAFLVPVIAVAETPEHPIGLFVHGGYQRYAMSDVNEALRDFRVVAPDAMGRSSSVEDGFAFGGGLRVRATHRAFIEFEAMWMHARSKGATTIEGLPHQATVDLPALGLTSTLGAQVHISDAISAGLGLGVGYYFTTGVLRLRHDFTEVRADMDAEALGIHALGIGEIRVGRNLAVEPSMGYRRAKARSLRVDEVEVRRADGSRIAPDWSGPVARIALVYYVGGD